MNTKTLPKVKATVLVNSNEYQNSPQSQSNSFRKRVMNTKTLPKVKATVLGRGKHYQDSPQSQSNGFRRG